MGAVAKRSIGPVLGLAVLVVLAVINLAVSVEAQTLLALEQAPMCDFDAVRGGVNWTGAIDLGCSLAGAASFFIAASPYGLAACAGWALGRALYQNL